MATPRQPPTEVALSAPLQIRDTPDGDRIVAYRDRHNDFVVLKRWTPAVGDDAHRHRS